MAKAPFSKKDATAVISAVTSMLAEQTLAKADPGQEAPGEDSPGGSSASPPPPESSSPPPGGDSPPSDGPPSDGPPPGGDAPPDASADGGSPDDPEAMKAEFAGWSPEQRMSVLQALFEVCEASGDLGQPDGGGADAGPPASPPADAGPPAGDASAGPPASPPADASPPGPPTQKKEFPASPGNGGKMSKSEPDPRDAQIADLNAKIAELTAKVGDFAKSEEAFTAAAETLAKHVTREGARRKAVTSVSQLSKSEPLKKSAEDVAKMPRAEVVAALKPLIKDLKKSDRDAVLAFSVNPGADVKTVAHLLIQ